MLRNILCKNIRTKGVSSGDQSVEKKSLQHASTQMMSHFAFNMFSVLLVADGLIIKVRGNDIIYFPSFF